MLAFRQLSYTPTIDAGSTGSKPLGSSVRASRLGFGFFFPGGLGAFLVNNFFAILLELGDGKVASYL